jgi:hypothetical protein
MKKTSKKKRLIKKSRALAVRTRPEVAVELPKLQTDLLPVAFHEGMQLLSIEAQNSSLAEYDARRKNFFRWLFSHLVEGIHFGYPPGCEGKYNAEGQLLDRKSNPIQSTQWQHKPCLYKSGVLFLIDILHLTCQYESADDAWAMLGKPQGTICRKCTLYFMGKKLGEGTGAYTVTSYMDGNASIKMADKRAASAAILNSVPLVGELFTQDIEEKTIKRRSMSLKGRQDALVISVENRLISEKSTWAKEPLAKTWIATASRNLTGNPKLETVGSIDAFESAMEEGRIDFNTATIIQL